MDGEIDRQGGMRKPRKINRGMETQIEKDRERERDRQIER